MTLGALNAAKPYDGPKAAELRREQGEVFDTDADDLAEAVKMMRPRGRFESIALVGEAPAEDWNAGSLVVSASATVPALSIQVVPADPARRNVTITNEGSNPIRLCKAPQYAHDSTSTLLVAGDSYTATHDQAIYAFSVLGSTVGWLVETGYRVLALRSDAPSPSGCK